RAGRISELIGVVGALTGIGAEIELPDPLAARDHHELDGELVANGYGCQDRGPRGLHLLILVALLVVLLVQRRSQVTEERISRVVGAIAEDVRTADLTEQGVGAADLTHIPLPGH